VQQGKTHERTLTTRNTRNQNKQKERTLQPDRITSHRSKVTGEKDDAQMKQPQKPQATPNFLT
jgi:hypothetical protein